MAHQNITPEVNTAAIRESVDYKPVTIWSQGVRLAGDLYQPKGLSASERLPGLLLVPGWGGSKKNLEANYAPHFAASGFIVLSFDFKGWGESDGPLTSTQALSPTEESESLSIQGSHIRKVINPISMSEDVRSALHYLGGEPQVMQDNLGIWGTSMGGALALSVAARDNRVKALVDQMGPVNHEYNLKDIHPAQMLEQETRVARGELPPFPGPEGTPNPQLNGYPDWVAMKRFNPLSGVDQLNIPTLIIDAEEEALFETKQNGQLLYEMIKDRLESSYLTYPGKHYDMYQGDNLIENRLEAINWFQKHLKGL